MDSKWTASSRSSGGSIRITPRAGRKTSGRLRALGGMGMSRCRKSRRRVCRPSLERERMKGEDSGIAESRVNETGSDFASPFADSKKPTEQESTASRSGLVRARLLNIEKKSR